MGQAMRMAKYDRASNEANAVPVLDFLNQKLKWHRLDDGVMGGRSETFHKSVENSATAVLRFSGIINTDGGGFCSLRAPLDSSLPENTKSIKMKCRGDGKTYKFILSDGKSSSGGPFATTPIWQADIPTEKRSDDSSFEEIDLPLDKFLPSFGAKSVPKEELSKYTLNPSDIHLIGVMLSLKLSDGTPNPVETFGSGTFEFQLDINSISIN